jgi:PAS domain S-box-containing protein
MQVRWRNIQTYWHQLPIVCRGTIAICIPLICLIGLVVTHGLLNQRIVSAQQDIIRSHEILGNSQRMAIGLFNAETSVRSYDLGKQKAYLKSYKLALSTLEPTLANLQQLVRDRPTQAPQAKLLVQIVRSRMQLLQQSIQRAEAKMAIGSPKSKIDLFFNNNRFGEVVERFEAEERRLLMLRSRSLQEEQQLNTSFIWGGSGIGAMGMLIALRILQQLSTELRTRQSRLNESQSLIRALVANVVDGVAIIDARGKIQSFNQAAVEMFGYSPNEVVNDDWHKLLAPAAEVNQNLFSHPADAIQVVVSSLGLASPLENRSQQAMGQRKNGDWFPIEFSIDTVADDALVTTQQDRIIIIRDITERQQAAARLFATNRQLVDLNDALNMTNRSLMASNRELDQFAYITAHDLKAPLRAIASLSEWIEEDLAEQLSAETRSQMQLLRRRVYRMQALLDSLLEYSRSGRAHNPISSVDVNRLLSEIVESLVPPATMTIEIRAPMPIFNTRKQPLQQVFLHLIDNAIRHHPTKVGRVEISALDLGDRYEFTIADDGDGIDPQYHDRIYTIFQTLTARDRQENVGVGLAIVKKIVAAEGGTIELDSAVGMGATFKFTWLKQPIVN